ncbi:MAG: hypothetical protein HEQ19_14010 [Gloeotrichia echinulata CP02]|jgi:hypothetical protein|nr:hypothetical protein [Gloeotrichia echinulata DEX184]
MIEPTLQQVFGANASIQSISGIKYFCVSLPDLESITEDILGESPNAEELFAAIFVAASKTLTTTARDGDVFAGVSPTAPNQNIALAISAIPTHVERNSIIVKRISAEVTFDTPDEGASKIIPSKF